MTTSQLEQRLAAVELELAAIKARLNIPSTSPNYWVEKVAGTFSSPDAKAAFDEAMRYGRKWRNSDKPKPRRKVPRK